MAVQGIDAGPLIIGRYAIFEEVARGGMAAVHIGRLCGPAGFTRTIAVKRLHAAYASDPEFVAMFLDEARLAARIQHPNVVSVMDVVATKGELFMVMEYIHGESFSNLLRATRAESKLVPFEIAVNVVQGLLFGLHAAHEARSDKGEPLGIVHRDVSPQNVLVGTDGVARVVDFGVAKAAQRMHETKDGSVKGKVSYMSPEQLSDKDVDRRTDVWAASVILWEALSGCRLFNFDELGKTVASILAAETEPPSARAPGLPAGLDAIVLKGLAKRPEDRWRTAEEMALALEEIVPPLPTRTIAKWVEGTADERLRLRADIVSRTEHKSIPPLALLQESTASLPSRISGTHTAITSSQIVAPEEATITESSPQIDLGASVKPKSRRAHLYAIAGGSVLLGVAGMALIIVTVLRAAPATVASSQTASVAREPAPTETSTWTGAPPATETPPSTTTNLEPKTTTNAKPGNTTRPPAAAKTATPQTPSIFPATTQAPAQAPTPATPAPAPTPVAPSEPARPRFAIATARVEPGAPTNLSGTSATNVNRVIGATTTKMTECYRAALPTLSGAVEGTGNLHIDTDEDGVIVKAQVSGPVAGVQGCIGAAVTGRKLPNADTGRARADIPLLFRSQ